MRGVRLEVSKCSGKETTKRPLGGKEQEDSPVLLGGQAAVHQH